MTVTTLEQQVEQLRTQLYEIKCEVLDGGTLPCKAHATDAGFDVFATSDFVIYPGQVMKHPLNIRLQLPANTYASIESKSGLGAKGLLVFAGVIDQNYRGIPHVVMTNLRSADEQGAWLSLDESKIVIKKGQKLAQLIPYPFSTTYYVTQVDTVDTNTDRATGGFGSSGV